MKTVSVLEKYCYDLDSSERAMMYYHTLNQARQFLDFNGRKTLKDEIGRVKNRILEGLN